MNTFLWKIGANKVHSRKDYSWLQCWQNMVSWFLNRILSIDWVDFVIDFLMMMMMVVVMVWYHDDTRCSRRLPWLLVPWLANTYHQFMRSIDICMSLFYSHCSIFVCQAFKLTSKYLLRKQELVCLFKCSSKYLSFDIGKALQQSSLETSNSSKSFLTLSGSVKLYLAGSIALALAGWRYIAGLRYYIYCFWIFFRNVFIHV